MSIVALDQRRFIGKLCGTGGQVSTMNYFDLALYVPVATSAVVWLYWWPTHLAYRQCHVDRVPIFLVNALLGWTFVGWVIALVWFHFRPETVTSKTGYVERLAPSDELLWNCFGEGSALVIGSAVGALMVFPTEEMMKYWGARDDLGKMVWIWAFYGAVGLLGMLQTRAKYRHVVYKVFPW